MKLVSRLFAAFAAAAAACLVFCSAAFASAPEVSAASAELMCLNNGEILMSVNAGERRSMASTTKIMTSLLLIEQATPSRVVSVREQTVTVEGTSMGLLPGDEVSFDALAHGMLLQSGNDAANTAAEAVAGSVEAFVGMMNARARELGMNDTHFVTPSGLDDDAHYSTAHDMALLAACALKNPVFKSICSKRSETLCYGAPPYSRTLTNHNRLLASYNGAIGVKTGFTKKSGRCLVSAAERGGVMLIAVTLNDPDDWRDHAAMLDYGFASVNAVNPLADEHFSVKVTGGRSGLISLSAEGTPALVNAKNVEKTVLLPHFVYAPVSAGQVIGRVIFSEGGRVLGEASLTAACDVEIS